MSVESLCKELRRDPRNPDIVRILKRIWELLCLYDETRNESYLGRITTLEVGQEMLFVASKIEHKGLDKFVSQTSGMTELLFLWDHHSPAAVRAARMEWLGEEAVDDPEYEQFRMEEGHEATRQFVPYITTMLSTCAGLPAVQLKAVSRLIALTLDPVIWLACQMGLDTAMATLAAIANPKSSFRDEFQKMGGLACVALCYLGSDEPERLNVFQQVLRNVTPEEFKVLSAENMFTLFKCLVANCFDQEIEDRESIVPEIFAKMYDTTVFQNNFKNWRNIAMWRKDCPSAFLLFVILKFAELQNRYPHASRHDVGLVLAFAFSELEETRKIYQWHTYPETRKNAFRKSFEAKSHIEKADSAQPNIGREKIGWDEFAERKKIKIEQCMYCGIQGIKLMRCGMCKIKWYCSQQCQARDWKISHKEWCGK